MPITHRAFPHPDKSRLRKMSAKTMISNQIQMMNKKIQSIVKKASSRGYEEAIIYQPFLGGCRGIDDSAFYVPGQQYAQLNDGLSIPEAGENVEPRAFSLECRGRGRKRLARVIRFYTRGADKASTASTSVTGWLTRSAGGSQQSHGPGPTVTVPPANGGLGVGRFVGSNVSSSPYHI